MSPGEHGEVFVLDDGSETDLDLGNYERFLDVKLTNDSNLTTGKIYQDIIKRERAGEYLGKTVQIIPHVTDEIIRRIRELSNIPVSNDDSMDEPDVCVIELGGTIGDLESGNDIEIPHISSIDNSFFYNFFFIFHLSFYFYRNFLFLFIVSLIDLFIYLFIHLFPVSVISVLISEIIFFKYLTFFVSINHEIRIYFFIS